jgi:hypothetical protein
VEHLEVARKIIEKVRTHNQGASGAAKRNLSCYRLVLKYGRDRKDCGVQELWRMKGTGVCNSYDLFALRDFTCEYFAVYS